MENDNFFSRHPVMSNVIVILIVAFLGVWIAYLSLGLFTHHGQSELVPSVENMSYTQAIQKLHDAGFRVDIRDSVYREDAKPGYVIEQFPKGGLYVKPGRKVFLYINAVHPREVIIDEINQPMEYALTQYSLRQGKAKLEELGFKNITIRRVPGTQDRIVRVLANGKPVYKMKKVAVNVPIILEVSEGMSDYYMKVNEGKEYEPMDDLNEEDYPTIDEGSEYNGESESPSEESADLQ